MGKFIKTIQIIHPEKQNKIIHIFCKTSGFLQSDLHLHLVVFYRIDHYLWVGAVPTGVQKKLPREILDQMHFGIHPQIYDPFEIKSLNGFGLPDDISHFVSQFPTSRFLPCTPESKQWVLKNNVTSIMPENETKFKDAFVGMKQMMRNLKMHFWMCGGTLLGWYRQCSIIPYTTDVDFNIWSKYVEKYSLNDTINLMKGNYY